MTCPVCASFGSGGCDCGDLVPPTVHDLARVKRRGIFTVEIETRKVFRSNVRGLETKRNARCTRMTAARAYLDAAWALWCEGHPCTCEMGPGGKIDRTCPEHEIDTVELVDEYGDSNGATYSPRGRYRKRAIARLARWLRWRDGKLREAQTWLWGLGLVLSLARSK